MNLVRIAVFVNRAALTAAIICMAHTALSETVEGFTEPYRKVDLVPAETGVLRHLEVAEGDSVVQGGRLGALDCEVQEIALAIARASLDARGQLESATAERELRKNRLEKLQELRASGHATYDEVDRAAAELAVAEANFLAVTEKRKIDELECRRIAAMLERRILKSPIDGVVTRVYKQEAEFLGATASPVITIMQLDPLRVTFSVPSGQAQKMHPGDTFELSLPESSKRAMGKVEFVSPVTEAESGTVRVKLLIENHDNKYRCGVRCSIDLDAKVAQR